MLATYLPTLPLDFPSNSSERRTSTPLLLRCTQDFGFGDFASSTSSTPNVYFEQKVVKGPDTAPILVMNDIGLAPNSGPSGGSRSQVMTGNAIKNDCEPLIAAMRQADGTFRTLDERVAENIPLKYHGKWRPR